MGDNYKSNENPRITRYSKFSRKPSVFENPQFINILKLDIRIIWGIFVSIFKIEERTSFYWLLYFLFS